MAQIINPKNCLAFPRKREARIGVAASRRSALARARWVPACAGMTLLFWHSGAQAQMVSGDTFADGVNGAKLHVASGFVCPSIIGAFERDAVGEYDPESGADFCAYSALDGVYGTIRLVPVQNPYDARQSLANDFAEQEGTGGKRIEERQIELAQLSVYQRTYEAAKLEDLHYRVEFTGAATGNWAVETTLEYAEPRDVAEAQKFVAAVYRAARQGNGTAH